MIYVGYDRFVCKGNGNIGEIFYELLVVDDKCLVVLRYLLFVFDLYCRESSFCFRSGVCALVIVFH